MTARSITRLQCWCEQLKRGALSFSLGLFIVFTGLAIGSGAPARTQQAQTAAPSSETRSDRITTIGMTVADLERSIAFYTNALDFRQIDEIEVAGAEYEALQGVFGLRMRIATLALGSERIELTQYLAPEGRPMPIDSRSNDRWFQHIAIIVSDMDRAYARLREHKARHASTGPQRIPDWNTSVAGIEAFYFKDPDGHVLEILSFPPDKGHPRWRRPNDDALFLGIDHTAIVVNSTDESVRFYRDALGMVVAGESENHGAEQEHLNNVFGARLRITSLRYSGYEHEWNGPAIELLEYLAPSDGRPYPLDSNANDIWHWQTTLRVTSLDSIAAKLRSEDVPWISPGVVKFTGDQLGFSRGIIVRDPDGHALRLVDSVETTM